jgi:hypothetical protein
MIGKSAVAIGSCALSIGSVVGRALAVSDVVLAHTSATGLVSGRKLSRRRHGEACAERTHYGGVGGPLIGASS